MCGAGCTGKGTGANPATQASADRFTHPPPLALLDTVGAVPSGAFRSKGGTLRVIRMTSYDIIRQPLDLGIRNEAWADRTIHNR
jgi:hypothetical protein